MAKASEKEKEASALALLEPLIQEEKDPFKKAVLQYLQKLDTTVEQNQAAIHRVEKSIKSVSLQLEFTHSVAARSRIEKMFNSPEFVRTETISNLQELVEFAVPKDYSQTSDSVRHIMDAIFTHKQCKQTIEKLCGIEIGHKSKICDFIEAKFKKQWKEINTKCINEAMDERPAIGKAELSKRQYGQLALAIFSLIPYRAAVQSDPINLDLRGVIKISRKTRTCNVQVGQIKRFHDSMLDVYRDVLRKLAMMAQATDIILNTELGHDKFQISTKGWIFVSEPDCELPKTAAHDLLKDDEKKLQFPNQREPVVRIVRV